MLLNVLCLFADSVAQKNITLSSYDLFKETKPSLEEFIFEQEIHILIQEHSELWIGFICNIFVMW